MKIVLDLLKRNIVLIVVVLALLAYGIYKFLKSRPKNKAENAADILGAMGLGDSNVDFGNLAMQVAHHLGTAYSPYDPRSWTENDEKVYQLLKDTTDEEFIVISRLYHDVYAKGRDLNADLARLLDDQYFVKLNFMN